MGQSRIDAVRHAHLRGNEGDLEPLRALLTEDVVAEAGSLWPVGDVAVGPDAVVRIFESMIRTFDEVESLPQDFIAIGDTLVIPLLWRGVPRGGSETITQQVVGAYTFRGDRISHLAYYRSRADALAAANDARA
jgi:ketosteroid isomerase-like protein